MLFFAPWQLCAFVLKKIEGGKMVEVSQAVLDGLREFDTATVFNALVRKFGLPNEEYMSHAIRCLLPELGSVVGYAVTAEVTTNDPDSPALVWADYYAHIEQRP